MAVHHEHLVGVIRQRIKAPEIREHGGKRRLLPHGHHFEVHARPDAVLRVRHSGPQLGPFFKRQGFLHLGRHIGRQIRHQVSDFVGVESFNGVDQLVAVHRVDQGLSDAVVHFNQNLAVPLALYEIPERESLIKRQRFEHPGNIGRMEFFADFPKFFSRLRRHRSGLRFLLILSGLFLLAFVFRQILKPLEDLLDTRESVACVIGIAGQSGLMARCLISGGSALRLFLFPVFVHFCHETRLRCWITGGIARKRLYPLRHSFRKNTYFTTLSFAARSGVSPI